MIFSFHARPLVGLRISPRGEPWTGMGEGVGGRLGSFCRNEELSPNRHQIIYVPLYIPYSFMIIMLVGRYKLKNTLQLIVQKAKIKIHAN